ncbi:replication initiation protein [Hoeflea olei]|uniref:Initiator Rep protein WH1 domain-containing protein n=1 Tax=Hoeflea olei TaxID=1480615 RepID=A0A1C1YS43_9HYPH|nr:replication initiation protein [Hoeflea olei]OCW56256.1 hypothetical protein AWJ14_19370 [Hoeflea olei]
MTKNFSRQKTTGADRRGVRGDIRLVHAKERPGIEKEPTVERSAALIHSVRYFGAREGNTPEEAMTATSAALYTYLLARWRPTLAETETFMVPFEDAKAYLQIEKTSRLRSQMKALSSTWVSYDFLDTDGDFEMTAERVQLLNVYEARSKTTKKSHIAVEMFPAVRKAILASEIYAHLELGAFPRFTSKYTSRLYPTLALMSGRDQRPPIRWTPEELADLLGWQPDIFKFSNFESRVLQPVLDDIRNHVRRFQIDCEYVRAATRGRPVVGIVITVGKALKMPAEFQKAEMDRSDRTVVRRIATSSAVDMATQMPGEDVLRRAATRLDVSVREIATMWTEAFADERITGLLERAGISAAFEAWVRMQEGGEAQIIESDEDAADEAITDIALANKVILYVAEGFDPAEAVSIVAGHLWTGASEKTLRLVWSADGEQQYRDIEARPTESDLGHLFRNNADVIEDMEYAA